MEVSSTMVVSGLLQLLVDALHLLEELFAWLSGFCFGL